MGPLSFKYWDDCVDPQDLDAMWNEPDVRAEWIDVGETRGSKVHLSRDPDGQHFLTQTEMRAVAGIIIQRHFVSQIDSDMLCAIAELESDRQLLAERPHKKPEEVSMGIMQISPKTADWLDSDLGYRSYQVASCSNILYKPFVSVYFGAAYLKWLSSFDNKERSEEFMVRAYRGGMKKATHKSTLTYWKKYLSVKESLPSRKAFGVGSMINTPLASATGSQIDDPVNITWDSRTSIDDMEKMWSNPKIDKEWSQCSEKRGKVRFSHDKKNRPYISRAELRAVSEIIVEKHFSSRGLKPTALCAMAEMVSMRFVNGVGQRTGLMGIDYPTARWLYKDQGYKGYVVECVDDLTKPFVSLYFGAAYMIWLSEYEGMTRTREFIVQAYIAGPQNVNLQQTSPIWLKFEEALSRYESAKKYESFYFILYITTIPRSDRDNLEHNGRSCNLLDWRDEIAI